MSLSYDQTGVNYDTLDAFKRACQKAAATTTPALALHGLSEPKNIRGESAYLIETPDGYLAHVEEGLGTKNLVADAMQKLTGESFYKNIGIDTVATMVNDLITCGALPISQRHLSEQRPQRRRLLSLLAIVAVASRASTEQFSAFYRIRGRCNRSGE